MNIKAKEPNTTECQQHHSTDLQTKDLSLDELEHKLGASSEGLSQTEVQKRLAQYGYNELPEKKKQTRIRYSCPCIVSVPVRQNWVEI